MNETSNTVDTKSIHRMSTSRQGVKCENRQNTKDLDCWRYFYIRLQKWNRNSYEHIEQMQGIWKRYILDIVEKASESSYL